MSMDAAHLVSGINLTLARMDAEFNLARASLGIRPNLVEGRRHAVQAEEAMFQCAELILLGHHSSIEQPPDVIDRVNRFQVELSVLTAELVTLEAIVATRSSAQLPRSALN